ncbi:cupin domain-containing protein [Erwiniaceae bacterium BAC15a-03b]|uniref:Cupin domain-containing protein n=1 Tax=Winslowiella arboricola TaxID=2978220 RepID=A0A9J6PW15_9GAMM|nr:cupin domain-containing protein [Winslowiella arboricola]MCU5775454.1 cupin domain-containing protein [Winslowiella arboricola]MCU5779696.1 cupin domain-containing protein [Winslowiella arboricola]
MNNEVIIETFENSEWKSFPGVPEIQYIDVEGTIFTAGPFVARVKLPAGSDTPAHIHHSPFVDRSTVISGTLFVGIGPELDKSNGIALKPGSIAFIPPGVSHYAWTEEETVIHVHGEGPWLSGQSA